MTTNLTAAGAMSPGTYIRKRREAAGLTIEDVAKLVDGRSAGAAFDVQKALTRLEADEQGDYSRLIYQQLPGLFGFDVRVLEVLVLFTMNPGAPLPPICRVCACTEFDPCVDARTGACGWTPPVVGRAPLCTACTEEDPEPGEGEALLSPANEGEVRHAA